MKHTKRFKIVGGGELALPAEFEQRWETHSVSVDDHGDHIVVRPALEVSGQTDDAFAEEDTPGVSRRGSTGMGY